MNDSDVYVDILPFQACSDAEAPEESSTSMSVTNSSTNLVLSGDTSPESMLVKLYQKPMTPLSNSEGRLHNLQQLRVRRKEQSVSTPEYVFNGKPRPMSVPNLGPLISIPGEGVQQALSSTNPAQRRLHTYTQGNQFSHTSGITHLPDNESEQSINIQQNESRDSSFGTRVQSAGFVVTVPDHPKAKLMYYLCVVDRLVGLDYTAMSDFQNYSALGETETDALLGMVMLLNPDELIGKVMFPDSDLCGDYNNGFYERIDGERRTADSSGNVKGERRAHAIMTFKWEWLQDNYLGPMRYYRKRLSRLASGLPGYEPFKPVAFLKTFPTTVSEINAESELRYSDSDKQFLRHQRKDSGTSSIGDIKSRQSMTFYDSCLCIIM